MAAVSLVAGGTTSDTGNTPNTSGSFTPTVGDLLVVCCSLPGSATGSATLTSSVGGNTFTRITAGSWPATPANYVYIFVADQLIASGEDVAQTVTFGDSADQGTGSNIAVLRVTGMSKVGSAAVRQIGTPDNDNSSGATPTVPFAGAFLTSNPTIGAVAVLLNPSAITEPTGWTERAEISIASPNNALEVVSRDSGSTESTMTWGSTYGQVGAAVAIELDASSAAEQGSGTPSLPLLTSSGTGKKTRKGSGAPSLPLVTSAGTGKKSRKGAGSPTLPVITAAGTGKKTRKGAGSPSLPIPTADGVGTVTPPGTVTHEGSGSPALPLLTSSGSGKLTRKGTGSPSLPLLTASGTGKKVRKGSGSPSLPLLTAAGTGKKTRKGSGAPTLPKITASGTGKKSRKGTGSPNLPLVTASGTGRDRTHRGSGTPTLPLVTAAGVGTKTSLAGAGRRRRLWSDTFDSSFS